MKAAAIQMVSGVSLEANLGQARKLRRRAPQAGAQLAFLPEYFCLMGHRDSDKLAARESFGDGPIQEFLASSARDPGRLTAGGTLPHGAACDERLRNSHLFFPPAGECVARYDKIHLFKFDNGR